MKRKAAITPGDAQLPAGYTELVTSLKSKEVHQNLEDEKNSSEFFEE